MAIVDNVKDIYTLVKKLGNQELLEKMADLRDEIFELREENRNLKEKLAEREEYNMFFERGVYWNVKDNQKEGPYCPTCWDDKKKAIRMHEGFVGVVHPGAQNNTYLCHLCKTHVSK